MVDVFDEVEEELRKERYMQMLRSWGPWVLGAAVAVIAGVAGYQGWRAWQDNESAQASTRFAEARTLHEAGQTEEAISAYALLASEGPRGYATLALLHQAALASEAGNNEEAARLYDEAVQRSPVALVRDLARYQSAVAGFDTLSSDDLALRLDPLVSGGSGFALLSRELIGAAALRDQRWAEARRHYEFVQLSIDASEAMRTRARDALAVIAREAPEEVPAEDSVDEQVDAAGAATTPDTAEAATEEEDTVE
ncbi:MAG: tetratricopeptide repeat protein [Glycocaulis sp.]